MAGPIDPSVSSKRVLEPIDRIGEILFGLIMVLTFTCTFSVAQAGRPEVRTMMIGALGCSVAWGVIDAVLYLMGCLTEKARGLKALRAVRDAAEPRNAHSIIAGAIPAVVAAALGEIEFEVIRSHIAQLPEPPAKAKLSKRDLLGALAVFLLVVLATLPIVVPFIFVSNPLRAQRVSNLLAVGMMYLTGRAFGRCSGYHPQAMGLVMVVVGGVLVGLTIMLGG